MGDNKRYYWLKLPEDFYDDDTIQWIEDQENGSAYVNFYLKLLLKSLSDDGRLIRYVGQRLMPYDVKSLARLTNTDTDTVRVALELFVNIGLVERLETGELYMNQIDEMIGTETQAAARMRKMRARKALLSDNEADYKENKKNERNNVTDERNNVKKCYTDNRDKIQDKEIEKELRDYNNKLDFGEEENLVIDYYYNSVKNNTNRKDLGEIVDAIKNYGWRKVFYTLIYLKDEQKANISGFNYVKTVLESKKYEDDFVVDYVVDRELRELKEASCE